MHVVLSLTTFGGVGGEVSLPPAEIGVPSWVRHVGNIYWRARLNLVYIIERGATCKVVALKGAVAG